MSALRTRPYSYTVSSPSYSEGYKVFAPPGRTYTVSENDLGPIPEGLGHTADIAAWRQSRMEQIRRERTAASKPAPVVNRGSIVVNTKGKSLEEVAGELSAKEGVTNVSYRKPPVNTIEFKHGGQAYKVVGNKLIGPKNALNAIKQTLFPTEGGRRKTRSRRGLRKTRRNRK